MNNQAIETRRGRPFQIEALSRLRQVGIAALVLTPITGAQGHIVAWGGGAHDSRPAPSPVAATVTNSGNYVDLRQDGVIHSWGLGGGIITPPPGVRYVQASGHTRLRSDGVVEGYLDPPAGMTFSFVDHYVASYWQGDNLVGISEGVPVRWGYGGLELPPWPPVGRLPLSVSAGLDHSAVLFLGPDFRKDIYCWGSNDSGQCDVPVLPLPGLEYRAVAAGEDHTLGLTSAGTILAWGSNSRGQCEVPALPAGVTYTAIDAGAGHSVALRSDGHVVAWGENAAGQCSVTPPPPGEAFVDISAAPGRTAGRLSSGVVVRWPAGFESLHLGLPACVELSTGQEYAIARYSDGTIRYWNGRSVEVLPAPNGLSYVEVDAGGGSYPYYEARGGNSGSWLGEHTHFVIARLNDGTLRAWGFWGYGLRDVPSPLPGTGFVQVSAGYSHAAAVQSDGAIVAWGWNVNGQCDVPPPPMGVKYVEVACASAQSSSSGSSPNGWSDVEYVSGFTIARLEDGSVVGWPGAYADVPGLPPGRRYTAIAAGRRHALALRDDGEVVEWPNPVAMPPTGPFVEIAAGDGFSLARRPDGTVAVWGPGSSSMAPPEGQFTQIAGAGNRAMGRVLDTPVYVDCSHGGPSAGTRNRPFQTLQEAVPAVAIGGTILVRGGACASSPIHIEKALTLGAYDGSASIH